MKRWLSLVAVVAACGGGKKVTSNPNPTPVPPADADSRVAEGDGSGAGPSLPVAKRVADQPPPQRSDHEPILSPSPWATVGVGQVVYLPATAIDPDGDETAVNVTS